MNDIFRVKPLCNTDKTTSYNEKSNISSEPNIQNIPTQPQEPQEPQEQQEQQEKNESNNCEKIPDKLYYKRQKNFDTFNVNNVEIMTETKTSNNPIEYCNKNSCIVRKKINITNKNKKKIENEINMYFILEKFLPEKENKYFTKIKAYYEKIKQGYKNENNFDFDFDDDMFNSIDNISNKMNKSNIEDKNEDEDEVIANIYLSYEGITLKYYIEKYKNISILNILKIMCFLMKILSILHSCNICHYDIKLENITLFVDQYNNIECLKLIDFGSALFIENEKAHYILKNNNNEYVKIQTNDVYITPYYDAPELINSERTCLSDIWSSGCVFFRLFVNKNFSEYSELLDIKNKSNVFNLIKPIIKKSINDKKKLDTELYQDLLKNHELISEFWSLFDDDIDDIVKLISSMFLPIELGRKNAYEIHKKIIEIKNKIELNRFKTN
jgi:serine/threonine protein kinase